MEKGADCSSALRRVVRNRPWSCDVLVPFSSGLAGLSRTATLVMLSRNFLCDALRLQKLKQVVRPACLRIRARHIEPAKGMRTHHRAGAFAIDVEISHEKLLACLTDLFFIGGIDGAGKT